MKKLALLLGLILMTTPLMAQEFTVNEARPAIVKKRMAGLQIDNINKRALAIVEELDADGEVVKRYPIEFQNIPEVEGEVEVGTIYTYNVTINGDNQQIESEKEITEYQGEKVELDGTRPKMEVQVIEEAKPEYNQLMNAIGIDAVALKNAIRIKLGL